MKSYLHFVLALTALLLASCEQAPGHDFTGTVAAKTELTMPLSRAKACVGRLRLSRTSGSGSGSSSSSTSGYHHVWAEEPTLNVDGETLQLVGEAGNPKYTEFGDSWHWNTSAPKKAPKVLWGWGHDSTFRALSSKTGHLGTRHVTVEEDYTPCGAELRVRAIRDGDRLRLVDTNPTSGRNALKAFGGIVAGFLCCGVLPLCLLVFFVIRRAIRKESEQKL